MNPVIEWKMGWNDINTEINKNTENAVNWSNY